MWIRSQDRRGLVDAKRIILRPTTSRSEIINLAREDEEYIDYDVLGTYESEERAKEVLDDIQNYFMEFGTYVDAPYTPETYTQIFHCPRVYQMPTE